MLESRILCYVTDRRSLAVPDLHRGLAEKMADAAAAGMDLVQIREKDLSARELFLLTQEALARRGPNCKVVVNDRLDVALATGADGVHLTEKSISVADAWSAARALAKSPANLLVGASVHSQETAQEAAQAGASYLIFGPVFATPSKASFGPPQGIAALAEVCRTVPVPVLAVGGVTLENARECFAAGAAGIAAIRLFQQAQNLRTVVSALRAL